MKKLRGTRAVALAASVAMLFSAFAISPANAAEGESKTCGVSTQDTFEKALADTTCSTIKISGDENGVLKFGADNTTVKVWDPSEGILGAFVSRDVSGYGKVITETIRRSVTVTADSETIMRNVQFDVESDGDLTFGNNVILDDAELSGVSLGDFIQLGSNGTPGGIEYGVKVNGGAFTMNGNARMAVGVGQSTTHPNRAIVVSSNGSVVNLNSSGTYDRKNRTYLLTVDLSGLGLVGDLLDGVLTPILKLLSVGRDVSYPTVWGRDAAVYSEPGVNNATINITDGSYSNQKDKEALGKTYLNGAVSSSATVNIAGTGNVQISNTKIGNGVTSDHAGSNTAGTLNISNPNAVLDPGTEKDSDATKHATDSWALELRGSAVANIVAGSIQDTSTSHKTPQVIESESNSRVNILSASDNGDVKIATRQYYIAQPVKTGAAFSSQVTYAASESEANADAYELWSNGSTKQTTTLAQLQDLVAKETAGSTPPAAKLSQSTYTTGKISAAYLEDVSKDGRAVYGRHEISFNGSTPIQGVNNVAPGKVVLYGLPWVGTYDTDGTAPSVTNKLFAGWYTSEDEWKAEDAKQSSVDPAVRHHSWDESLENFNGTFENRVVVSTSKYTGTLYPHFVDAKTMGVVGVQVASTTKPGKFNLRFVAGTDSNNFQSVRFDITYNGKYLGKITSAAIYEYILAQDAKQVYADSPLASDAANYSTAMLGDQGDARYIFTGLLSNVKAGAVLDVAPSWTTLDGVKVSGTPFTITVNADGTVYKQYK